MPIINLSKVGVFAAAAREKFKIDPISSLNKKSNRPVFSLISSWFGRDTHNEIDHEKNDSKKQLSDLVKRYARESELPEEKQLTQEYVSAINACIHGKYYFQINNKRTIHPDLVVRIQENYNEEIQRLFREYAQKKIAYNKNFVPNSFKPKSWWSSSVEFTKKKVIPGLFSLYMLGTTETNFFDIAVHPATVALKLAKFAYALIIRAAVSMVFFVFSAITVATRLLKDLVSLPYKTYKSLAKLSLTVLIPATVAGIVVVLAHFFPPVAGFLLALSIYEICTAALVCAIVGRFLGKHIASYVEFRETGTKNPEKYYIPEVRMTALQLLGMTRKDVDMLRYDYEQEIRAIKSNQLTLFNGGIAEFFRGLFHHITHYVFGFRFKTQESEHYAFRMRQLKGESAIPMTAQTAREMLIEHNSKRQFLGLELKNSNNQTHSVANANPAEQKLPLEEGKEQQPVINHTTVNLTQSYSLTLNVTGEKPASPKASTLIIEDVTLPQATKALKALTHNGPQFFGDGNNSAKKKPEQRLLEKPKALVAGPYEDHSSFFAKQNNKPRMKCSNIPAKKSAPPQPRLASISLD